MATCLWACSGTEQTALLQSQLHTAASTEYQAGKAMFPSLSSLSDPKSSRAALAQIKQTVVALNQDRSQVTPLVQQVVATVIDTLDSLFAAASDDGAINKDHLEDQAILDADIAGFPTISQAESIRLASIVHTSAEHVSQQREAASGCYTTQEEVCGSVEECTGEVRDATTTWSDANAVLVTVDGQIDDFWCLDPPSTGRNTSSFQQHSANNLFRPYNIALDALLSAKADLVATTQTCVGLEQQFRERLVTCTALHENSISTACSHFGAVVQIRSRYLDAYYAAVLKLNEDTASIELREGDRKVEWEVLKRVVCLLSTLTATSDSAMPEDGSYNAQDIEDCQTMLVDVTHLSILYPSTPPLETLTGLLPNAPMPPCDDFSIALPVESTCEVDEGSYGGGPPAQCYCAAASADPAEPLLPSLPHYLFVDPMIGNAFSVSGDTWSATVDGTTFTGVVAPCFEAVAPQDDVTHTCHVYGSPSAAADAAGGETLLHHFMSHGGVVYKSGETVVRTLTWSPMTGTLGQDPQHISMFGTAESLGEGDHCPLGYMDCLADCCPPAATGFCWHQPADGECRQGCLIYQFPDDVLQYKQLV